MGAACDFCQREQFGERIFSESPLFYWILGRSPIRPGHTIVIPKRHVRKFEQLKPTELNELLTSMQHWVPKILQTFGAVGYNLVVNVSPAAGQTVPHLHLHIIPRTAEEQGKLDRVRQAYYRSLPEHERPRLTKEAIEEQVSKLMAL